MKPANANKKIKYQMLFMSKQAFYTTFF